MSELVSLEKSLLDLLSKLNSTSFPIILGGGYGLYLRRTILEREGTRTLLENWPEARSTNDLDLFLRPELLCDSARLASLKSALDELGYTPIVGAEHYQFRKDDPDGFIQRGIKIDLLTGPSSRFEGKGLKVDERRVRPNPSVKVHAHPTDEAITLAENLQEVNLQIGEDQERANKSVFLPHPFTYSLMKLFAFRDQVDDATKGNGSHHALDLYSIIAMMTESQWKQATEMARANADSEIGREAHGIVFKMFNSMTSKGLLVMRANPYCSDKLQLAEFIELIRELF
jgi:hypothetical protein